MSISAIPAIVAIVASLNQATKWFAHTILKKDINQYIPLFSVVYGILAGLLCVWQFSEMLPEGTNWIQAIVLGIISGASSTGFHQFGKQMSHRNDSNVTTDEESYNVTDEEVADEEITESSEDSMIDVIHED